MGFCLTLDWRLLGGGVQGLLDTSPWIGIRTASRTSVLRMGSDSKIRTEACTASLLATCLRTSLQKPQQQKEAAPTPSGSERVTWEP